MIDSVALVFGSGSVDAESRRIQRPLELTSRPVSSTAVNVDLDDLAGRLGRDDGQLRRIVYGDREKAYGHWQVGDIDLMYRGGRLELRASLPKLLTGRNDVVLSERGVRDGLAELVRAGAELVHADLDLDNAVLTRADEVFQWNVPSVAEVISNVRPAFQPRGKRITENVSPRGGRSLVYGYGSKRVIRLYDKVLELAEQGEASNYEPDTLLRLEIQERRRPHLRLIHERGYRAADVREDLAELLEPLRTSTTGHLEEYVRRNAAEKRRLLPALGALQLAESEHLWPIIQKYVSRRTYYDLRKAARLARLELAPWMPQIPADAFEEWSVAA